MRTVRLVQWCRTTKGSDSTGPPIMPHCKGAGPLEQTFLARNHSERTAGPYVSVRSGRRHCADLRLYVTANRNSAY